MLVDDAPKTLPSEDALANAFIYLQVTSLTSDYPGIIPSQADPQVLLLAVFCQVWPSDACFGVPSSQTMSAPRPPPANDNQCWC